MEGKEIKENERERESEWNVEMKLHYRRCRDEDFPSLKDSLEFQMRKTKQLTQHKNVFSLLRMRKAAGMNVF